MLIFCFILIIILFMLLSYALLQIYRLKLGDNAQDKLNESLTNRLVDITKELNNIKNNKYN